MPRNTLWDWITCQSNTVEPTIIPATIVTPVKVPTPNLTDESTAIGTSPSPSSPVKDSSGSSPFTTESSVGLELVVGVSPTSASFPLDPELYCRTKTSASNPTVTRSGKVVFPSPPEPSFNFSAPKGVLREIQEEEAEAEPESGVIGAGAGVGPICPLDFATNRYQLIEVHARRDSLTLPDGRTVAHELGVYEFGMTGVLAGEVEE